MNTRPTVFCLLVFLLITGCKKDHSAIYFVPIGAAPMSEINELIPYYRNRFGVETQILGRIAPSPGDMDGKRRQLIAENVVESMLRHYPEYAHNSSAILIGITDEDMYPRSQDWQFCFGWRMPESRAAVVSTARMELHYLGEPPTEATLEKRLRKVITKDIGILYLGKQQSENPKSVLYSGILGIQELDRVGEDF